MKKIIATTMAAGLVAAVASAEVGVTMDFASAYVFRGTTWNDGAVFQPGIEASGLGLSEEYGAVTVGAWGNYNLSDYDDTVNSSDLSELDMYFSYSLPTIVDNMDLFVGYCDYTYPGATGTSEKEASVGIGYSIADVSVGATYYQGIGGGINGNAYAELSAGYDLAISEELAASFGARVGYADYDGGENGFSDYDLSAGISYALSDVWSAGASIAYIGQIDDDVLGDADIVEGDADNSVYGYDVDVVGMLSLAATF